MNIYSMNLPAQWLLNLPSKVPCTLLDKLYLFNISGLFWDARAHVLTYFGDAKTYVLAYSYVARAYVAHQILKLWAKPLQILHKAPLVT